MSPGVGPDDRDVGANVDASAFADRPPGSDWMFSFWVSMMSKLIKSSVIDILYEVVDSKLGTE